MSDRDAEVRSQALREAVAWLRARADALYAAAGGAVVQLRAASETLDAAGAPAGPLVERVRACTRDGGWRDQWEALRQAKDADDIARARATRDVDILRRAARAAAVSLGEVLPDDAGPEAIAAALRRATQARVRPTMLTVAIPDLGIVAAHGDTAQALADDVASQVLHAVRDHALAAPEFLPLRAHLDFGATPLFPTESNFHLAASDVARTGEPAARWRLEAIRERRQRPGAPLDGPTLQVIGERAAGRGRP